MNWSYGLAWIFFKSAFALYFRASFFNAERVPTQGPVILAANHASILDPPLVAAGFRRMVNFLGRNTLFDIPVFGAMLRSWRVVPVDREGGGGPGLRAILNRLLDGGIILLFPEGTRSADGQLRPAKPGIGLTVIKSSAPVVPVRVFGTLEALGRNMVLPRPRRVCVKYGQPIDFSSLRAEAKTCSKDRLKQIYLEAAERIMKEIAGLEARSDGTR